MPQTVKLMEVHYWDGDSHSCSIIVSGAIDKNWSDKTWNSAVSELNSRGYRLVSNEEKGTYMGMRPYDGETVYKHEAWFTT